MSYGGHRPWLSLASALSPHVDELQRALERGLLRQRAPERRSFALLDAWAHRELTEPQWSREVARAIVVLYIHSAFTGKPIHRSGHTLEDQSPTLWAGLAPLLVEDGAAGSILDGIAPLIEVTRQKDPLAIEGLPYLCEALTSAQDADERRARGVFYTPQELVAFIVASVDQVLIEAFELPEGLADTSDVCGEGQPFLRFLDPAMGTGLFLLEIVESTLGRMETEARKEGLDGDALAKALATYVQTSLAPRISGYEFSLAPIVFAHLELGHRLEKKGCTAIGPVDFRWANPLDAHYGPMLMAPGSQRVIVGNPPYRSASSHANDWLDGLLNHYRQTPSGPMQERGNRNQLQDDYVKFLRVSEHAIAGLGIVAMVTNSSFYEGPWFRAMRYQLMESVDRVDLLHLHGGSNQGGLLTNPDGERDENLFPIATPVAVTLLARCAGATGKSAESKIHYGEIVGGRARKLRLLKEGTTSGLCRQPLEPLEQNYWRFLPFTGGEFEEWRHWTPLPQFFKSWGAGVLTNRNGLAIDESREALLGKVRRFADLNVPTDQIEADYGFASNYRWDTGRARERFATEPFADLAIPYLFRPFDRRWIYWHRDIVYNMRGDKLHALALPGRTLGLMFSRNTRRASYTNLFVTDCIADRDCLEKANIAPLHTFDESSGELSCNLDEGLKEAFISNVGPLDPRDILHYAYALLQSGSYRSRYFSRLQMEFPRLPLNTTPEFFRQLCTLGADLVALHLLDESYPWASWNQFPEAGLATLEGSPNTLPPKTDPVWNYYIGGYPVLRKYIKGRGARPLDEADVRHLRRMHQAISRSLDLSREVDALIEARGGWNAAFPRTLA